MTTIFTETGEPLEEAELMEFENQMQIRLPGEYRQFLLEYNGGRPDPNLFVFQGKNEGSDCHFILGLNGAPGSDLRPFIETHKERLPRGLFPVAYDSLGNLICLSVKKEDFGKVYFWDHQCQGKDGEAPQLISQNFGNFIQGMTSPSAGRSRFAEGLEDQAEISRIIESKDLEGLKALLGSGYDLDATDDDYLTLLDRVTIAGDLSMVKLVVAAGAKVDDALEIARDNAQFEYPGDHKAIVLFLEKIQNFKSTRSSGASNS